MRRFPEKAEKSAHASGRSGLSRRRSGVSVREKVRQALTHRLTPSDCRKVTSPARRGRPPRSRAAIEAAPRRADPRKGRRGKTALLPTVDTD
ncbi:hypothetical protein SKAU_G00314660 [Synaphobranchus kaupii]|uniref:Uncharacterized protein n=1 Tax=Synaphobranchus kaupii TaxID=118154 RepID=A0A9Q1ESH0_SYNKA|nr:hypothetical protein SKAU_G00314660 [Synaphobranchus kaupii]